MLVHNILDSQQYSHLDKPCYTHTHTHIHTHTHTHTHTQSIGKNTDNMTPKASLMDF